MGEWGDDLWKSAYSMIPQSTVVDSLNQGMVRIYNDEYLTRHLNIDILAQVHDSILMQVPIEAVLDKDTYNNMMHRIYDYVSPTIMYNGNEFKIATDAKCGLNWGGMHKQHNKQGMQKLKEHADIINLLETRDTHVTGTH